VASGFCHALRRTGEVGVFLVMFGKAAPPAAAALSPWRARDAAPSTASDRVGPHHHPLPRREWWGPTLLAVSSAHGGCCGRSWSHLFLCSTQRAGKAAGGVPARLQLENPCLQGGTSISTLPTAAVLACSHAVEVPAALPLVSFPADHGGGQCARHSWSRQLCHRHSHRPHALLP